MRRDEFTEMSILGSCQGAGFTRAAAKLGLTRSALSHTISALEERLGIRLLPHNSGCRTHGGGERLMETPCSPISTASAWVSAPSARCATKPSGEVRVVCPDDADRACVPPPGSRHFCGTSPT